MSLIIHMAMEMYNKLLTILKNKYTRTNQKVFYN